MKLEKENLQEFEEIYKFVSETCHRLSEEQLPEGLSQAMEEFAEKSKKLQSAIQSQNDDQIKESILEAEQAGDSVKRIAENASNVDHSIAEQVQQAHDKVCQFKSHHLIQDSD